MMEKSKAFANLDVLSVLTKASPKVTITIIKEAGDSLLDAISECARQIVAGTVQVDENKVADLSKLLPVLNILAQKKTSRKKKRFILMKKGFAILAVILPPVIQYILRFV